ncbi:MAG: hypothetical protein AAFQ98_22865 [Bacteroidota bacterium]
MHLRAREFFVSVFLSLVLLVPSLRTIAESLSDFIQQAPRYLAGMAEDGSTVPTLLQADLWLGLVKLFGFLFGISGAMKVVSSPGTGDGSESQLKPGIFLQNLFTIAIVVLAVYFSITAMIAASLTQSAGVVQTNFTQELSDQLEQVSDTDTAQEASFLRKVNEIVRITDNNTAIRPYIFPERFHVQTEVVDIFGEMLPDMKRQVLNQMKASDEANLVTSLKQYDMDTLLGWYQAHRRDYIRYLGGLVENLVRFTNQLENAAPDQYQTITDTFAANFEKRPRLGSVPKRSKQGDYLGIFEEFMGWLLEIESYSLVMVIGMAGFGLLGAASGSFIRETDRRRKKGGPLVADLPGVMIKGFTASMVIFLGIQGSLTILGGGGDPPDSNLLFFLALVAAVFSDKAWDWAEDKFEETLAGEKGEEEPPPGTGTAPLGPPVPSKVTPPSANSPSSASPFAPTPTSNPTAATPADDLPNLYPEESQEEEAESAPWMSGMLSNAGSPPTPEDTEEEEDGPPDFLA